MGCQASAEAHFFHGGLRALRCLYIVSMNMYTYINKTHMHIVYFNSFYTVHTGRRGVKFLRVKAGSVVVHARPCVTFQKYFVRIASVLLSFLSWRYFRSDKTRYSR